MLIIRIGEGQCSSFSALPAVACSLLRIAAVGVGRSRAGGFSLLQQLPGQVAWGDLDVLSVDLPPGTGDVQLTLCQRARITGAIVVSTPQDVALLDARKAIDMFDKLKTPVLGLIENMSTYVCPNCGHEAHLFGHGGVEAEAARLGLPFLGALPLALEVREAGDAGRPVALGAGAATEAYAAIAAKLIAAGVA